MKLRFVFCFFLTYTFAFGQSSIPKDYFQNPLNITTSLSGNFGELRNNHFHSGLDIRTQQRIGLEVFASAEGFISRIKTDVFGYGNVLYIQHPNGYTTVYGHLEEFNDEIREYVRKRQYAQEKNTIELFPEKGELPVKKGDYIAKSGESGSAGGPHLHFEIRDGNQHPMNPLLFGFKVKDTRKPVINDLRVYPQNNDSYVQKSSKNQKLNFDKVKDGQYTTTIIEAYGRLGFGINTVDFADNAPFKNGLYEIMACLNGEPVFDIKFDKFSFANSRYINRYIDYELHKRDKNQIQKLFLEPNNHIDVSLTTEDNGFVEIKDGLSYNYEIILKDFDGNETSLLIPIKGKKADTDEITPKDYYESDYLALADKASSFELEHHDVYIPSGALYENTYLNLESKPDEVKVHEFTTPLHKNITVGFNTSKFSKEEREKLYVARVFPWGKKVYSTTYKDGNRITTKTREFGVFTLEIDDKLPSIKPVNFKEGSWMSKERYLQLKIEDEGSGISTYRATINGKFIALEYDYKSGIARYDFRDKRIAETENKLKVIVVDNVGNSSTFEATFFRKE